MNYMKTLLAGVMVLLACMLPCVCSSAAAAEEAENYAGMTEAEWRDYILTQNDVNTCPYYCAGYNSENSFYFILGSNYPIKVKNGSFSVRNKYKFSAYRYDGQRLVRSSGVENEGIDSYFTLSYSALYPNGTFIANHNITYEGMNDIFFRNSPLARLIQSLPLEEMTMKEVVALLPLLIAFLVSVTGFWKGLRFLSRILHKA